MTERRKLKKELSKWRHYKNSLPRLIDCSDVYGDSTFTDKDVAYADFMILTIEEKLKTLPINP